MRFMMVVKASTDSEAGVMPTTEMFETMGKYNEAEELTENQELIDKENALRDQISKS